MQAERRMEAETAIMLSEVWREHIRGASRTRCSLEPKDCLAPTCARSKLVVRIPVRQLGETSGESTAETGREHSRG